MPLKVFRLENHNDFGRFLRGGIMGGKKLDARTYGLHGKTLVFSAGVVTFADPTDAGLTIGEIVQQIKADVAVLAPTMLDRRLAVEDADVSAAVSLNCGTSTAATAFGFPASGTVAGTVYAEPGGTAPKLVTFSPTADALIVVTEEA